MRLPRRLWKSVEMPEPSRYTRPVNGSSISVPIDSIGKPRAAPAIVWIIALVPMSTRPEPMISVTSDGSLGSSSATLMPSLANRPLDCARKIGAW